jgi:hypothetical protein
VVGLELEAESLEYYYTFGSLLAFERKCDEAEAVFLELESNYRADPIVAAIIAEGRSLCAGA